MVTGQASIDRPHDVNATVGAEAVADGFALGGARPRDALVARDLLDLLLLDDLASA